MSACRSFLFLTKKDKLLLLKYRKAYSTGIASQKEKSTAEEIIIPYRINRGPTDILKALASTISKDYTAPKYKYEDDPYFIPASNIAKRAFALSKESGRKAARYFLERYPEFFKCNTSVPQIKAFDPPVVYTEENVKSSDVLLECIRNFEVSNSIKIYEILKEKDIPVSHDVKQELLELFCFYNGNESQDEDYYEERYFAREDPSSQEKWTANCLAEKLFEEMEKDSRSYSALISGAVKFKNKDRALELFEEMKSKGLTPTLEAYNSIISMTHLLYEMGENRWEYMLNLLSHMDKDGVKPDIYTMNAVLSVIAKSKKWKKCLSLALTVLSEMKRLNITPSLGTYSYILQIFGTDGGSACTALNAVLAEVENKEFYIQHPSDVYFFSTAMELCNHYATDKSVAYRINNLLEYKQNSKLLGNAFSESIYFKHFFQFLCETEDLDKFMEVYEKYVPNTYTPEPSISLAIINSIHFNGMYKYLPKLCSDVLVFEHSERENILSLLMEAAGIMKHEEQIQKDLVDMVWKIVEKLNIRSDGRRHTFNWTGQILGNILKTFLYGDDLGKSWTIMKQLESEEEKIIGFPEKEALLQFCEFCLLKGEMDKVNFCLKYAKQGTYLDFADDLRSLGDTLIKENKIAENHRLRLNNMLRINESSSVPDDESSSSSDESSSSSSSSSSEDEDSKKENV